MKKRFWAIVLVCCMLIGITACGAKNEEKDADNSTAVDATVKETDNEPVETGETPDEDMPQEEEPDGDIVMNVDAFKEGNIVYDNNNIVIKVTSISDYEDHIVVYCEVENNNECKIQIHGDARDNAVEINGILFESTADHTAWSHSLNEKYVDMGANGDGSSLVYIDKNDCTHYGVDSIDKVSFYITITLLDDNKTKLEPELVTLE